eukprot:g2537.t1
MADGSFDLRPSGVPLQATVVIADSNTGLRDVEWTPENSTLTLKPGKGDMSSSFGGVGREFRVEKSFSSSSTQEDIYEHVISPLLQVCVEGVSTCLLTVGETFSGKSEVLGGGADYNQGIIPLSVEGLFGFLEARGAEKQSQMNIRWNYSIQFSLYELYNEKVSDLLNAQNKECSLKEDPLLSFSIENCTVAVPTSAAEMISLFRQGWQSRISVPNEYGNPRICSTTVLQVDVIQTESQRGNDGAWWPHKVFSRFLIIDCAGTEKLMEDKAKLRIREPSSLSKSIFGLNAVAKVLGASSRFTPYDRSLLTKITMEALGGNCVTVTLACVRQGEGKSNEQTMNLVRLLQRVQNFPVPNDERVQGLLRRLRLQVKTLKKQLDGKIQNIITAQGSGDGDTFDMEFEKNAHKRSSLQLKEKMAQLKQERTIAFDKLEELRKQFDKLTVNKSKVQMQLIEVEEEKLRVSKALLDVQIELNEKTEAFSKKEYELVNKLLQAENDILELEMKATRKHEGMSKLQDGNIRLAEEKKAITLEFVTIKNNFHEAQEKLTSAASEMEILNAEILSLANQKRTFKIANEELEKKVVELEKLLHSETRAKDTLKKKNENMTEIIHELKGEKQSLESEKAKLQLLLRQESVSYKSSSIELERNTVEYTRARDQEYAQLQKKAEEELKRYHDEISQMRKIIKKKDGRGKTQERQLKEMQVQVEESNNRASEMTSENDKLRREIEVMTRTHRLKLIALMASTSEENSSSFSQGKELENDIEKSGEFEENFKFDEKTSSEKPKPKTSKIAVDILLNNFREREKIIRKECDELRRKSHNTSKSLSRLSIAYRDLWNQVNDLDADSLGIELPSSDLNVLDIPTASELEKKLTREIDELRARLKISQNQTRAAEEIHISEAERFTSMKHTLEKHLNDVKGKLRILSSENEILKSGIGGQKNNDIHLMMEMKSLQQNLVQQLNDLRSHTQQQHSQLQHNLMNNLTPLSPHSNTVTAQRTFDNGEVQRWRMKAENYENELRKVRDKLQNVESKNRDLQRDLNTLEQNYRDAKNDYERVQRELSQLRHEQNMLPMASKVKVNPVVAAPVGIPLQEAKAVSQTKESAKTTTIIEAPIMEAPPDAVVQIEKLLAANKQLEKEVERLVSQLSEKLPNEVTSMQGQLKDVEKRIAEAKVNEAMAVSELKNYQLYMKKTIAAFKKKEKKYKSRIKELGGAFGTDESRSLDRVETSNLRTVPRIFEVGTAVEVYFRHKNEWLGGRIIEIDEINKIARFESDDGYDRKWVHLHGYERANSIRLLTRKKKEKAIEEKDEKEDCKVVKENSTEGIKTLIGKLHFNPAHYQNDHDLKLLFDTFDFDSSGSLDANETAKLIEIVAYELGKPMSMDECQKHANDMDTNTSNKVEFDELMHWYRRVFPVCVEDVIAELTFEFNKFDVEKSGALNHDELVQLVKRLGIVKEDENVEEIIESILKDREGGIRFEDFQQWHMHFYPDKYKFHSPKSTDNTNTFDSPFKVGSKVELFFPRHDEWIRGTIVKIENSDFTAQFESDDRKYYKWVNLLGWQHSEILRLIDPEDQNRSGKKEWNEEEEDKDLRIMFDAHDINDSGTLSVEETSSLISNLAHVAGIDMSDNECRKEAKSIDKDGSNKVEFLEIMKWYHKSKKFSQHFHHTNNNQTEMKQEKRESVIHPDVSAKFKIGSRVKVFYEDIWNEGKLIDVIEIDGTAHFESVNGEHKWVSLVNHDTYSCVQLLNSNDDVQVPLRKSSENCNDKDLKMFFDSFDEGNQCTDEEKTFLAISIQSLQRGRVARQCANERREKVRAAVSIQSFQRGRAARQFANKMELYAKEDSCQREKNALHNLEKKKEENIYDEFFNRFELINILQCNGLILQYCSSKLCNDYEIVLTAVQSNGNALRYASIFLQNNFTIAYAAITQNGMAFQFCSQALQSNKRLLLCALATDLKAFQFASEVLKCDKKIAMLYKQEQREHEKSKPDSPKYTRNSSTNIL